MENFPERNWTLTELFLARVRTSPQKNAYRWFDGHSWVDITWGDTARLVGRYRAALESEKLVSGDRVGICSKNRLEWVCFDQAALSLGLVVVPLFYNDRPDNMAYCLNDAGARLLLIEDGAVWEAMRSQETRLERVVCIANAPSGDSRAVALAQWLPAHGHEIRESRAKKQDLATLVYTSGTTGRPKGVMLTHENIVSDVMGLCTALPEIFQLKSYRFLSFLPLSHMLERTVGYYIPMYMQEGTQVVFARSIQDLADDLVSQKPDVIVSVPRIFERVYSKVEANLPPGSLKRRLFDKTVEVGWRRFKKEASLIDHLLWPVLDRLVARKLRARLGGRLEYVWIGGAALAPHLMRIFTGMGLTFIHGYGLTETSPAISCNLLADNDPMSVGHVVPGNEVRVSESGELMVRGPIVMKGYWNNPQATAAVIDSEGWFRTGDLVEIHDNRIYIRGRVKEIIVLSNGEKVPPTDAEQAIMRDTVFEQAMVVGEGRSHLGLLCVSQQADEKELCERANRQLADFPGYAKIRHLARLSEPWTVENGLITPTLKLKRNKIEERFAGEIDEMYRRNDVCGS